MMLPVSVAADVNSRVDKPEISPCLNPIFDFHFSKRLIFSASRSLLNELRFCESLSLVRHRSITSSRWRARIVLLKDLDF